MSLSFDEFTEGQKSTEITVELFNENKFLKSNLVKLKRVQYFSSEDNQDDDEQGSVFGVVVSNRRNKTLIEIYSYDIKRIYDSENRLIWENSQSCKIEL